MKRVLSIWSLLITLTIPYLWGADGDISILSGNKPVSADSILDKVIFYAPLYETLVSEYNAEMYIKHRMYIRKNNHLIRYVPAMVKLEKGVKEYLMESYSDLHFTAPNIYDQKVRACTGTVDGFRGTRGAINEYFHVNIYSTTLLNSKLMSPLSATARKYYEYRLDSIIGHGRDKAFCISFEPRNRSYQLVRGYMVVSDNVWSIREMQFSGRSEYLRFDNLIVMGEVGEDNEFLPVRYDLNTNFSLLGNKVDATYLATFDYKSIKTKEIKKRLLKDKKKNYDLTESYTLRGDTTPYYTDTLHFSKVRPLELTCAEKKVYADYYTSKDTTLFKPRKKSVDRGVFRGNIEDILINDYTLDFEQYGSLRGAALLNPLLLNFSGRDGVSYRHEFRYRRKLKGDRLLSATPRFGYNFKHKEFYWRLNADFGYWPRKRAALHLNIGNGNRIYNSLILDELKAIPDSVFDFDKIHLDYFRDFYIDFRHSLEVTNGFSIDVGLSVHKRTAVKTSEFVAIEPEDESLVANSLAEDPGMLDKFRNSYVSFAPRIRLSWTPGQYYYMDGDRKVNLHSQYPTFTLDWERGLKGVFGSIGSYERFEIDMQHKIYLSPMRTLFYRIGGGGYTKQKDVYFVDYVNFSKNNLPTGWSDDIGGAFQELDRRWYNSSRNYVRANVTLEAPFLLLPLLSRNTHFVLNERLYLGALVVPHLNPYIELGYGIGTHIFDIGIFASSINGKMEGVGFKITFELFNR